MSDLAPSLSLRDYAFQAVAAGRWGEAAIVLRRHLAERHDDGQARLQLGVCYLRLGQLTDATEVLEHALDDATVRAVALTHLGRLACGQRDFARALALWQQASRMMAPDTDASAQIVAMIAEVQPLAAAQQLMTVAQDQPRLVFSGPSIGARTSARSNLGEADYSYGFAARGFLQALAAAGAEPELVVHPEYVANSARFFAASHCVHLRFSPPTNPRLIRGATNILIFAWEFDELPMAQNWPHPFADRRAVINLFDEVWMPSRHGAAVIARLTDTTVRFVPSPVLPRGSGKLWNQAKFQRTRITRETLPRVKFVPLSVFPQFQRFMIDHAKSEARTLRDIVALASSRPKIFLTIANPHDQRKNLRPLIEAFTDHARKHDDAILLIKTSAFDFTTDTINDLVFTHQLAKVEEALEAFVSKSIWLCNQSLSDDDLDELYSIADFYICSPIAEGQNLPLLEAMLRGCVPVAPRHTAMLDYLTDENAIIIPSRRTPPTEHTRQAYQLRNAEIDEVTTGDVSIALEQAGSLSWEQVAAIALVAELTVRTQYSGKALAGEWKRLQGMAAGRPSFEVEGE